MIPPNAKTVSFYHLLPEGSTQRYGDEADVTAQCGFFPMDRKDALLAGPDLIDPYELYCPPSLDVRLNDLVEVTGQSADFYVKHIFDAPFGGHGHKRVTISCQK